MEYAVVSVPAAAVRRKPAHWREMSNQLLFGESVQILKEKGSLWVKIRSLHDNYEGWVTRTLLEETNEQEARTASAVITVGLMNTISFGDLKMNIPMGASLPFFENGSGRIGQKKYEFDGYHIVRNERKPSAVLIEQLSMRWLNAPYLWGGRTHFGVDCSGFVQTNFKMMGIDLPRDAWQQAQEGREVKKFKDIEKGDLAFFDDKEEIVHVGILLDNEHIIHASGRVRIDKIDKKGIINSDTGKQTHQLRSTRRYW